ncbi:hypothetical protein SOCEGT47_068090 [Sorangium cellulosum]|uniref:Scramblase n=1 Tax=Sorangium cellulosum TaxID=56 RepID=A0A4P2QAF5_SORCE|nr:hypothetical protein [Sorangium cellulosum]AUX26248.1 hypothetical protein SOCEGT47_068090 [Sorangium cellulosum]
MQTGAPMIPSAYGGLAVQPFAHPTYTITRPFWSLLGRKFHVHAPDGSLVCFVKHPLLKLRQEFTLFADESETQPLLTIRARQVVALNRCLDVFDARTGERVGTIRSRGLKSIVRDTWDILDPDDQPVGLMQEDGAAMLRRLFPLLIGKWHIELHGQEVAKVTQVFRFFVKEFTLDLSMNQGRMDARFAIACALLALMAETARESR